MKIIESGHNFSDVVPVVWTCLVYFLFYLQFTVTDLLRGVTTRVHV